MINRSEKKLLATGWGELAGSRVRMDKIRLAENANDVSEMGMMEPTMGLPQPKDYHKRKRRMGKILAKM
jgi:hypothetical protein